MSAPSPADLQRLYEARFRNDLDYRRAVWQVLVRSYFQRFIRPGDAVLDLGCGYGKFINEIQCGKKFAMDLNPDAPKQVSREVTCFLQDCAARWPFPDGSLDAVFTSNFFEHLSSKAALGETLAEARRCLKPGGRLMALGPNVRYLAGEYWDFWDHHIPLTERSLAEVMQSHDFKIEACLPKFLPYTMARGPRYPLWTLRVYLRVPLLWKLFGKQFLVIGKR